GLLINVDRESRPEPVGRVETCAAPAHGLQLPAGAVEHLLDESDDRFLARRPVHGYKSWCLRCHHKRIALLGNAERGVLRHTPERLFRDWCPGWRQAMGSFPRGGGNLEEFGEVISRSTAIVRRI